ncbi:flavin reductase family protein [Alloscardovia omnicolens]|uniref:flavin reductase family protein n=1 Tax=Alloscardovia omnicolens TaxID=419015 RepID=UPI003A5D4390
MLVEFTTEKFYSGYPIFMLAYKDEDFGYNVTTNSSTYSLRNNIVMGVSSESRAAQQIEKFGEFAAHVASEPMMRATECAGWWHDEEKLSRLNMNTRPASTVDAPLLTDFPVIFECRVKHIEKMDNVHHIFAAITTRWIDDSLLNEDHTLNIDDYAPVLFAGDGAERAYKFTQSGRVRLDSYME